MNRNALTFLRSPRRRRGFRALAALLAAAAAFATAAPASAAAPDDRGWFVGLRLLADHIGAEDPGPSSPDNAVFVEEGGGGVELLAGYAFTPAFALRLAASGARHETTRDGVELNHATFVLEALYRFLPGERARPYLAAGLGGAALEFDSDALDSRAKGGVATIGAGVLYRATPHLGLDLGVRVEFINWDSVEVTAALPGGGSVRLEDPVDEDGNAAKLLFGVIWEF